jgi:hypothetical protein
MNPYTFKKDGQYWQIKHGGEVWTVTDGTKGLIEAYAADQVKRFSRDTSASANASPVEHKHEHPPTPTIEEQLDAILDTELQIYSLHTGAERQRAVAALTLLITKAELKGRIEEVKLYKESHYKPATRLDRLEAQLKATTGEPNG